MHLHNHSRYSIIDGRATTEEYLKLAVKDGQRHFALTDHGNLGGIIEGYNLGKQYDINFIAGMELYVDAVELKEKNYPGHLTVLAVNEAGYRALIAANNLAHRQYYYRPRLTLQQLVEENLTENWIILSGCMSSPIASRPYADALNIVKQLSARSHKFFLEAMWHWSADPEFKVKQDLYLERVSQLRRDTGLPVVLTNDCHYAHEHQEEIHLELLKQSHTPSELEFDGVGFHFKTTAEMQDIANGLGCRDAVDNAASIAALCELHIPEADKINWYVPDLYGGDPLTRVRLLCSKRLSELPGAYMERFEHELSVLATSPAILNSYLVAHDIISWCHDRGIPAAARGSMAGSLVSHLLGITTEDPIAYNLSFSRAVNPARPTIPDFDLDVSSLRRQEVIEYLEHRYEGIIPICSYTHYGPKGALRKILRMEGYRDQQSINDLCRPLPEDWATGDYEYSATGHRFIGKQPWTEAVPSQYENFLAIYQGLFSSMSVHPCGMLVSGPERQIEHEVPFNWIASSKTLASAYDMYTLKKLGLFKLDVLGLRTLDQLAFMEKMSGDQQPTNYSDPTVLAAFGAGLLAEVFQMDGYACREVIKSIGGINTFEDVIAANTLARPGASQFTRFYRSGSEALLREYPTLNPVLAPTNGLILYQEQVMEIARILADFDDAEQDDIKESIKYFRHEVWLKTIEPKFRERCTAKGIDATSILEAISQMASYTYNRAHAMTYAALAYKMMWYKIYHPAIYYAAVYDGADDKSKLILESHFFKVKWHPPDINLSEYETVLRDGEILLGLSAIKGVGPAAVEAVTAARPFADLADLEERVERRKCNKRVITAMKDAFALRALGEEGKPIAFEQAFGFHYQFLDSDKAAALDNWEKEERGRLAGFIVNLHGVLIKKPGPNQGKEMGRAVVVNRLGSKSALLFPDTWKKAKGLLYTGAAVRLRGQGQVDGSFVVESGELA